MALMVCLVVGAKRSVLNYDQPSPSAAGVQQTKLEIHMDAASAYHIIVQSAYIPDKGVSMSTIEQQFVE